MSQSHAHIWLVLFLFFFFFHDTATTEIYTLSLHDALPISFIGGCPPLPSVQIVHAFEKHLRGSAAE